MYMLIRLLIGSMLFVCGALVIHKLSFTAKRRKYIIAAIMSVVFITFLAFMPLENILYTFDSAEIAFQYYTGAPSVKLVVNGENSTLIIGEKENTDIVLIIPKTENGWEIDTGASTKMKSQTIINDAVVYLYQHQTSGDYYISIVGVHDSELELFDSHNSVFYPMKCVNGINAYYASISVPDHQYWLCINGSVIPFTELE